MGGVDEDNDSFNDVWLSSDEGRTWTRVTDNVEWPARRGHSSVALDDGSILLMGGRHDGETLLNDVWRFQQGIAHGVWKTEIGVLNPSGQEMSGILYGFQDDGTTVWSKGVTLDAHKRFLFDVEEETSRADIRYMRLDISNGIALGYQKLFRESVSRVGFVSLPNVNQDDVFIPHIASDNEWWTSIGWMNSTGHGKNLEFNFDDGQQASLEMNGGSHSFFMISSLFDGEKQPGIGSAQVSNSRGMAGVLMFGTEKQLSGVNLSGNLGRDLVFPHIADNQEWWTGVLIYNPHTETTVLEMNYYNESGALLGTDTQEVPIRGKYVGTPGSLGFPENTAWFSVSSTLPVSGFELFGTTDGSQLAGYSVVDLETVDGTFPEIEMHGWTGLALVNPANATAELTLEARDDEGEITASEDLTLAPGEKRVGFADSFFSASIEGATYVRFDSTLPVVGFQLNGSEDQSMLDALPALGSSVNLGTQQLYFPHISTH